MTPGSSRIRIGEVLRAAAPLAVVGFAAAILLLFPPEQYSFYPQCPVYRYLHLECPGCGTTRALAELLHGHIIEALRLNAVTTLLVPPAVVYGVLCYLRFLQGKHFRVPQPPATAVYAALAVMGVFTVIRNLVHL